MNTTRLPGKGQVAIPESLKASHHGETGLELMVADADDGILLRPRISFEETCIKTVAACLKYKGNARSPDDMNAAISKGVKDKYK